MKSPLHEPILIWSDGYIFGIKTWSSSLNFNFPPDCVKRCTAGVHPPETPKQSHEIDFLGPTTFWPS